MAERKEDRRVRRTKRLLAENLIQLMLEKPARSITVKELTERADVNRGTFYLYYRDIYDLIDTLMDELCDKFLAIVNTREWGKMVRDSKPGILEMLRLIEKNQDLCRALLSQNGDMGFVERLDGFLSGLSQAGWMELMGDGYDKISFAYRYKSFSYGIIGMVKTWLSEGCKTDARTIAGIVDDLLYRGIITEALRQEGQNPEENQQHNSQCTI